MNTMQNSSVSIVLPVYSETQTVRDTLRILLNEVPSYLKEVLIIISPKSSPESFEVCEALAKEHPQLVQVQIQKNNPGLGWAYREGMERAKGDYVVLMNADLETDPKALKHMIQKMKETDCDGVIANRWMKEGGFKNYDRFKLVLNFFFQSLFRTLYWTKLYDLTFGYKILKKEITKEISWESERHEISTETTLKPLKKGYKLEQVPCFWEGRKEGESKNNFFRNFYYVSLALKILFTRAAKL